MKKIFNKTVLSLAVSMLTISAHAEISTDNGVTQNNDAGITSINSLSGYDTSINSGRNLAMTGDNVNVQATSGNTYIQASNIVEIKGANQVQINQFNTGRVTIGNANNTTTIQSGNNIITGAANSMLSTGDNTITAAGTNAISGATNNMTATTANYIQGPVNNIGTSSASVNTIGNTNTATTVTAKAANAQMALTNNSAQLTVPSGATGVNNGVAVTNTQSTLTGGDTSPTRLTMNDNAATFSRVSNGAPITVTGVADGRADFDAVNVRQFAGAIAAVAAQANVPTLAAGQDKNFGIGLGNFMGKTGLAAGMNIRGEENRTYKLSISTGLNGGAKTVIGAGAAWAF